MNIDKNCDIADMQFVNILFDDGSESDGELNRTPENFVILAQEARSHTLLEHSRNRYKKVLAEFESWLKKNKTSHISETVLPAYFEHASKSKAPSSLWAYYFTYTTMW